MAKALGASASGRFVVVELTKQQKRMWRFVDIDTGTFLEEPDQIAMDDDILRSWSPNVDAVIIDGTLYNLREGKSVPLHPTAIFLPPK